VMHTLLSVREGEGSSKEEVRRGWVIDLSDNKARELICPTVLKLAQTFHDARTLELNTWIRSQSPPPSSEAVSEEARRIWTCAVERNTSEKIDNACWGYINYNKDIENKVVTLRRMEERIKSLEASIIESDKHLDRIEASRTDGDHKDSSAVNKIKTIRMQRVEKLNKVRNEMTELSLKKVNYQPTNVWDTMKLLVSKLSIQHFVANIESLDTSALVCILNKLLPYTSVCKSNIKGEARMKLEELFVDVESADVCRSTINIMRMARNKWGHKENISEELMRLLLEGQKQFVFDFLSEFGGDDGRVTMEQLDKQFYTLFNFGGRLCNTYFPPSTDVYCSDMPVKLHQALSPIDGEMGPVNNTVILYGLGTRASNIYYVLTTYTLT
jgi:hypothetical protein